MPLVRGPEPLIRPDQVPELRDDLRDVSGVFNPGAAMWRGREWLLLRVQTRGRTTVLLPAAAGPDGRIEYCGPPLEVRIPGPPVFHLYDPRLTVIGDVMHAVCAVDDENGCRLVTLRTSDFERWDCVGEELAGGLRNGVLFPERAGGRYLRLQRPNDLNRNGEPASGTRIELAASTDLLDWAVLGTVMEGRPHYFDELIGSGPPPVKTAEGWLHLYHGVATHFGAAGVYQAGVVLLDLEDPSRLLARGAFNILEPRRSWELAGQVPNVVFPTGMVVDDLDEDGCAKPDSTVRVYYGAADTVVGLATSTIAGLLQDARYAG